MSHDLFDLTDRVALVSGAASGLGKAMATGLAEAGADLVLADINPDGLATTAKELAAPGRRTLPVTCDMSQPEQIRTMFELIDEQYGRIDIVGNERSVDIVSLERWQAQHVKHEWNVCLDS